MKFWIISGVIIGLFTMFQLSGVVFRDQTDAAPSTYYLNTSSPNASRSGWVGGGAVWIGGGGGYSGGK